MKSPAPLVAVLFGLLAAASPGCVVHYGEGATVRPAEPVAPPADFAEVQARLEALVGDEIEVDRRDRIDAALDLLRMARSMTPAAQERVLDYLQRVVAIEERAQPMEAPAVFATEGTGVGQLGALVGPAIEEEDLGGVEQVEDLADPDDPTGEGEVPADAAADVAADAAADVAADAAADVAADAAADAAAAAAADVAAEGAVAGLDADVSAGPVSLARAALDGGDAAAALAALEPCDLVECGEGFAALRQEAVDAYVHAERERAGALFVRARGEADMAERVARLQEARSLLAELLDRFPDAAEADDIRRNIDTVQQELEAQR